MLGAAVEQGSERNVPMWHSRAPFFDRDGNAAGCDGAVPSRRRS